MGPPEGPPRCARSRRIALDSTTGLLFSAAVFAFGALLAKEPAAVATTGSGRMETNFAASAPRKARRPRKRAKTEDGERTRTDQAGNETQGKQAQTRTAGSRVNAVEMGGLTASSDANSRSSSAVSATATADAVIPTRTLSSAVARFEFDGADRPVSMGPVLTGILTTATRVVTATLRETKSSDPAGPGVEATSTATEPLPPSLASPNDIPESSVSAPNKLVLVGLIFLAGLVAVSALGLAATVWLRKRRKTRFAASQVDFGRRGGTYDRKSLFGREKGDDGGAHRVNSGLPEPPARSHEGSVTKPASHLRTVPPPDTSDTEKLSLLYPLAADTEEHGEPQEMATGTAAAVPHYCLQAPPPARFGVTLVNLPPPRQEVYREEKGFRDGQLQQERPPIASLTLDQSGSVPANSGVVEREHPANPGQDMTFGVRRRDDLQVGGTSTPVSAFNNPKETPQLVPDWRRAAAQQQIRDGAGLFE